MAAPGFESVKDLSYVFFALMNPGSVVSDLQSAKAEPHVAVSTAIVARMIRITVLPRKSNHAKFSQPLES
jgi:hypothetical protein